MRQTKTETIDGVTFEVNQLPATKGSQLFVKLLGILAPIVATGDRTKIQSGFAAALTALRPEDMQYFCDAFASVTFVDGRELSKEFDMFFAGRYGLMLRWLWLNVEWNFSDVLKGTLGKELGALAAGVSASSSPKVATGPVGAS